MLITPMFIKRYGLPTVSPTVGQVRRAAPVYVMHCSRRLQGVRGRLGLGRAGVSPLLRHSPVRAPPPGDDGCGDEPALPLPVPDRGPFQVYLGNWPRDLHELEIAALFHKYNIYPKHIRLHRKPMFE